MKKSLRALYFYHEGFEFPHPIKNHRLGDELQIQSQKFDRYGVLYLLNPKKIIVDIKPYANPNRDKNNTLIMSVIISSEVLK